MIAWRGRGKYCQSRFFDTTDADTYGGTSSSRVRIPDELPKRPGMYFGVLLPLYSVIQQPQRPRPPTIAKPSPGREIP
ncbi:MAG: hypothetical protein HOQ05_09895 [Corynebacteriales bacterium]|nr:hypothetical protein [Mycobacteriales bacterium]